MEDAMNGVEEIKSLINGAVNSKSEKERNVAIKKLCKNMEVDALGYIAKRSNFPHTRKHVALCLYQMRALSVLRRLLNDGPKDVRDYADILLKKKGDEFEEVMVFGD